jgi:hypothetical protein
MTTSQRGRSSPLDVTSEEKTATMPGEGLAFRPAGSNSLLEKLEVGEAEGRAFRPAEKVRK